MSLFARLQALLSAHPSAPATAGQTPATPAAPSAATGAPAEAEGASEQQPVCTRYLPAGQVVVREGDPGHSMFVVLEGRVAVLRGGDHGGNTEVGRLGAGEFFGELALLTGTQRTATIVTVEDAVLLELTQAGVRELGKDYGVKGEQMQVTARERLLADALRSNPLIAALPPEVQHELGDAFVPCTVPAGETLLTRGQPGDALYVLIRGQCEVFHTHSDGRHSAYPKLEEGALFGEISLLRSRLATATVRTVTPCTLLKLERDVFKKAFLGQPDLRGALVRLGLERLKHTIEVMGETK
ncbi:cyclic nucleotide-binding domain-containing protein [Corallococcus sp. AB011P]|uniref:cyclic nucleotide-binding domain-containing protein n=1 Tax=unclassified Corallococcus TaxID=2685029 RepID=UPI000EA0F556|nr:MULTISPECIES: cyclic nucleotide-binding domain-containing protein [unclassified Corallococcus]RKG49554.1 cyclic nucleotide-binding domain-containing protein [Corallococcus sp. AB011P]RKH79386.1 cyclic nucleotide-binding domain-containing protein [Corallococcus sp. AB045]